MFYRLIKLVIPGLIFVKISVLACHACPLAATPEVDWTIILAVVVHICIVSCHIADELFDKVMALFGLIIVWI